MTIDISRQTSNVLLPAEVSSEIWAKALEESAIMQLARQIRIPVFESGSEKAPWAHRFEDAVSHGFGQGHM